MKKCQPTDFDKKGFKMTDEFSKTLNKRLCPDIPKDDPNYIIKNLYSNKKERINISIMIFKCNATRYNCKDDKTM